MNNEIFDALLGYWTPAEIATNINIFCNILGALILGLMVGFERSHRGRAAGMRTYGMVCMASCALTVIAGNPEHWYGHHMPTMMPSDPGRIIQGITTGVGFLGAGVITRDNMSISGLTTAASIWAVAAIGVLVGIGFYGSAIMLAVMSAGLMMWGSKIELLFPARHAVGVTLLFHKDIELSEGDLTRLIHSQGYDVAKGSFSVNQRAGQAEWRFVAVSRGRHQGASLVKLSGSLRKAEGVQDFNVVHARN